LFPRQTAPRHPVIHESPPANKQRKGIISNVTVNASFKLLDCISCTWRMRCRKSSVTLVTGSQDERREFKTYFDGIRSYGVEEL
ncbi:hypothetical protein PISMIDRAFT_679192, partial [Pisolithus microcarpus 441]